MRDPKEMSDEEIYRELQTYPHLDAYARKLINGIMFKRRLFGSLKGKQRATLERNLVAARKSAGKRWSYHQNLTLDQNQLRLKFSEALDTTEDLE